MNSPLEHILVTGRKADMVAYIENNPGSFEEALELAVTDRQPVCWRATWIIKNCMKKNDIRVQPYVGDFVNILANKNEGHQRELLKVLLKMELEDEYISFLYEFCVRAWKEPKNQSSLRHTSIGFILKYAKKNPDFAIGVSELADDIYLNSLSQGIRRSVQTWFDKFLGID